MLPHSLDIISDYLGGFQPPDGQFDPNGDWDHRYLMWIALRGPAGKSWAGGALRIRRRAAAGGDVELQVSQMSRLHGGRDVGHTQATVMCARDTLATPRRWEIESAILDEAGKPTPYTQTRVSGEAVRGEIVLRGEGERRIRAPKPLTSNWSLFDAVQRLSPDTHPLSFAMIEDLELVKRRQRIAPRDAVELELGGRRVRLLGFEQIGEGILPYTYWLDEQHRLLFAVGGLRTFLFDPSARLPEDEP
jgi:hypothetical protein